MTVEAAALGFEILSSGIAAMSAGDVDFVGPSSPIGVVATGIPPTLHLHAKTSSLSIFSYTESSVAGVEQINVDLQCHVQYDGPQVQATFQMPHHRSRLMNDTHVRIENPLSLQTLPLGEDWVALGIHSYPVVQIPVTITVDRMWPYSNYNVSFMLVISGLKGFGADGMSTYESYNAYWD